MKEKLNTFKVLDCSTGHGTKEDMDILSAQAKILPTPEMQDIIVYEYPEGFWWYVSKDDTRASLKKLGLSAGLRQVFMAARKAGCKYINLNCDGVEYDQFTHYDW